MSLGVGELQEKGKAGSEQTSVLLRGHFSLGRSCSQEKGDIDSESRRRLDWSFAMHLVIWRETGVEGKGEEGGKIPEPIGQYHEQPKKKKERNANESPWWASLYLLSRVQRCKQVVLLSSLPCLIKLPTISFIHNL